MGYTHYYNVEDWTYEVQEQYLECLPIIRDIVKRYRDIIQFECDDPSDPKVDDEGIRFNGIDDDRHDTFYFKAKSMDFDFCKTNGKPYDLPVCEILLVLRAYIPSLRLNSDGFYICTNNDGSVEMDGEWETAIENVRVYGINFEYEYKEADGVNSPRFEELKCNFLDKNVSKSIKNVSESIQSDNKENRDKLRKVYNLLWDNYRGRKRDLRNRVCSFIYEYSGDKENEVYKAFDKIRSLLFRKGRGNIEAARKVAADVLLKD